MTDAYTPAPMVETESDLLTPDSSWIDTHTTGFQQWNIALSRTFIKDGDASLTAIGVKSSGEVTSPSEQDLFERQLKSFGNEVLVSNENLPQASLHDNRIDADLQGHTQRPNDEKEDDEKEPYKLKYCHCDRGSFGEMFACDSEDCAIKLFHLECTDLACAPA